MEYRTPGVYIEEIALYPRSVTEVATAIPAFIGYTEFAKRGQAALTQQPTRINSIVEYEQLFGGPARPESLCVTLDTGNRPTQARVKQRYLLYYSLRLFFDNGGRSCYIVSVGDYAADGSKATVDVEAGIDSVRKVDEITLLLLPDATLMGGDELTTLQRKVLQQCATLQDRFAVFDLDETVNQSAGVTSFRNNIGMDNLNFGAAYTPHLLTTIPIQYFYQDITLVSMTGTALELAELTREQRLDTALVTSLNEAIASNKAQDFINKLALKLEKTNDLFASIVKAIQREGIILPPSGAIAGIYAKTDNSRGVWKAPANISLNSVRRPTEVIDSAAQRTLNVDVTAGKSINAIRTFPGKGTLIWGARTLAGNDQEWRYIPTRRFFNMVEESVKKSSSWAVFEPNDAALWSKLKAMIENYLLLKWRDGALQGSKPEHAFYARVGLGETMTSQDILEGRLIIEMGMAMVRPAEFVILKLTHKMQQP